MPRLARCLGDLQPIALVTVLLLQASCSARSEPEPRREPAPEPITTYLEYLQSAPELRRVRQDPELLAGRWDTWLYMPWRYRWHAGTGEAGGALAARLGINGGVLAHGADHGAGPLDWLERWSLRFYNDHTAGKGDLFLLPRDLPREKEALRDPRRIRPRPLDDTLLAELEATIARNLRDPRRSPQRVAYALDDEISTGSFTRPIPWRLHEDDEDYRRWLRVYYGGNPPEPRWVGPDEVRGELRRPLREIDLSPLLDRMTYNDSVWAVFLGRLVERCNREDPETPCGFVGGQSPSLWGGYDWAKLAKKIQFVEAYDLGSSQEILRSFLPDAPRVTTHFHDDGRGVANDIWLAWHYFAHGNRGMIGWVEGWFEADGRPRPWLERFAPTLRELGGVQGRKMAGARWLHDGIAIYYSHPSIQVSWCLDAEPHGGTWPNRNTDHRLGTSHNVRQAWELMLADAGLQYDYLAYDEVAVHGVPAAYRVLILPAAYALSDLEARRIAEFAERGGTVIADFAPGLFDHHGRGRSRGALDGLFGVEHRGDETRADFFGGDLWVETDQEEGFGFRTWRELFDTVRPQIREGYAVAERRLPAGVSRAAGRGRAVYLNLSPQRYRMYREEGSATEERRRPFLAPVFAAGAAPRVRARRTFGPDVPLETTVWRSGGRTLVFILQGAEIVSTPQGRGGAERLASGRLGLEVRLAGPVTGAVDERTGRALPDGDRFTMEIDATEAAFFSFQGPPPPPTGGYP